MTEYREILPSSQFAETIECFWTSAGASPSPHRVMPDGCADILLTRTRSTGAVEVIGPMTFYRDYMPADGTVLVGVRFRPSMWRSTLGIPANRITDGILPLEELWDGRARQLVRRLDDAASPMQCAAIFERFLCPAVPETPVQKAVAWMEKRRGRVSVDRAAALAGLSPRQFRRLCLEQTGLTPKFLARVLRFRHALARLGRGRESMACIALDCGYYDQAHCIRDVREFSGRTPGEMAVFSNPRELATA